MSHILIVDDKEQNCYYLASLLKGHGHTVDTACHGAEALLKARQRIPDLIISDLLMPVMDGYTLLRHWKADRRLTSVPFIVYTATYTDPEDERLALSLGADAFILKPTEPDDFLARIRAVKPPSPNADPRSLVSPLGGDAGLLQLYSETLIRKLEEKMLLLEEANRALEKDLAERKRTQQQIADAQRFNQTLIESSPLGIVTYRANGEAVTANAASPHVLDVPSVADVKTHSFHEIEWWESSGLLNAALGVLASGRSCEREVRTINSFGKDLWLHCRLVPFAFSDEHYLLAFFEDIRERKVAELKLLQSEETQRRLAEAQADILNALPAHIALLDLDGVIVSVNESWKRFAAANQLLSPNHAVGQNYIEVCDQSHGARAEESKTAAQGILRVLRGELRTFSLEYPCHSPSEERWFRMVVTPLHEGRPLGAVVMHLDVTDRRQLEEQVRQAQKMEAVGRLAAGVAHDFNNILAAILGNVHLGLMDLAPGSTVKGNLEEIERASVRATSLVQQILAFSRQQTRDKQVIDLGPVVQETANFLLATIPASVRLITSIDPATPPVLADPTQMHQVIANLCTNAWHALEDQPGTIEIRLQGVEVDAHSASRIAGLKPGSCVCLSVSDTGKGMDPQVLERIFEPFFTTKEKGKGSGLGLSVVHGIVQDHDGAVSVSSRVGRGTLFQLYFPAASVPVASAATLKPVPGRGGGQHVLFLDDEEPLVAVAKRMLDRLGYRVAGFTRPSEAIGYFRQHAGEVDVVITDLNMPGISGLQAAAELSQVRPGIPIVLCSGHLTEELKMSARAAGVAEVISKPSDMHSVSDLIQRLTAERRRP
jgi:PAS domain S-box-containing protein